jgi:hypothetical protein
MHWCRDLPKEDRVLRPQEHRRHHPGMTTPVWALRNLLWDGQARPKPDRHDANHDGRKAPMSSITFKAIRPRCGIDLRSLPGSSLDRKHEVTCMSAGNMAPFRREYSPHDHLAPPSVLSPRMSRATWMLGCIAPSFIWTGQIMHGPNPGRTPDGFGNAPRVNK